MQTSAFTPSVDWIKHRFSVTFLCYLLPSPIFYQSTLGVKAPMFAWGPV